MMEKLMAVFEIRVKSLRSSCLYPRAFSLSSPLSMSIPERSDSRIVLLSRDSVGMSTVNAVGMAKQDCYLARSRTYRIQVLSRDTLAELLP